MFVAALLFVGTQGAAGPAAGAIEQPDPKAMSYAQIKAFNAKVPRGHPYYIRCVKSAAVGSLVARNVSCRTNEQWKKAEELANDEARDVMEHTKGKMMSGN
jgi:hypothetical protein